MAPETTLAGKPPLTACGITVRDGRGARIWQVPEETPVAFVYDGRNYAVMLATPADVLDFAVGFSLTERVVDAPEEVRRVDILEDERGIELRISIDARRLERFDVLQKRRNLVGRAGCGLCGLENADTFFETLPRVAEARAVIPQDVLTKALGAFRDHQPLNRETHTVHGAAWVDADGTILLAREDVGRHNALDKLLGALALAHADMASGFVLLSSRCSYEIIEKSARRGVRAVATLSAPTAFAVRKAQEANMTIHVRDGEAFVTVEPE